MELAVLIKVVPDHEALGFDPNRLHAVRDGVELFLNPFDQKALRVALDLRQDGDHVSVASMGPPAAAPILAEAFALGADRVSLVSDPALAGSDTLVTAQVLTRLLGRWEPDLVLLGARSTDGETGQVPAEIAALRNVPFAASARRVEWQGSSRRVLVTTDEEGGWARWSLPTPCVISVGEKVAKIVHPSEEDLRRSASRSVDIVTLADLGIPPGVVGSAGSPTRVISVQSERTQRRGVVLAEGSLEDRIAKAVRLLRSNASRSTRTPRRIGAPRAGSASGPASIVLVSGSEGRLDERALPMLSESSSALGLAPFAFWIGPPIAPDAQARLARAGAAGVFHAEVRGARIEARAAALTLERILLGRTRFEAGLFLSSPFGREVGGRVAARLGLGLTGDAVSVGRTSDGTIVWAKPAFGGNAVAQVVSRTRPSLATVRPGVFELGESELREGWTATSVEAPTDPPQLEPEGEGSEPLEGFGDLDRARVAVSVGVGVGGPAGIERIRATLAGTDWAISATRRVVDAGWVPRALQVGLTGRSCEPDLVILLGVRGSPNHLVGWKRAGQILAINSDPSAPVFSASDVGLLAPWEEALPALVRALRGDYEGERTPVSGSSA